MARRIVRSCLQSLLKAMSCVMAVVGIAMILYGLWMIRVWQRDMEKGASFYSTAPWFIYASLGLGLVVCLMTCIGYIAASSTNGYCLSCVSFFIFIFYVYRVPLGLTHRTPSAVLQDIGGKQMLRLNSPSQHMLLISLLVLLEIAVSADILLNSDWEKDLPEDPTGRFADFEEFVKSNSDIFKWIGLIVVLAQGLSILLCMVLRSMGSYDDDGEDGDRLPAAKLPLLHPPPPYLVKGDPDFTLK